MKKYEFVSKKEYTPVRIELENIIKKVQVILKKEFTFQFKLVGSGGRHLITREVNGNKGFDFDYNLILNQYNKNAKYVKEKFIDAINKAVKGTNFSNAEDSTTSITIKVKNTKASKIEHSCDFAIVYYLDDSENHHLKYIRHDKNQNQYIWAVRHNSYNIDKKLEWLKNNNKNYWNELKYEHYLKLKENNKDPNKHSFQLYHEAVNNMYNKNNKTNKTNKLSREVY